MLFSALSCAAVSTGAAGVVLLGGGFVAAIREGESSCIRTTPEGGWLGEDNGGVCCGSEDDGLDGGLGDGGLPVPCPGYDSGAADKPDGGRPAVDPSDPLLARRVMPVGGGTAPAGVDEGVEAFLDEADMRLWCGGVCPDSMPLPPAAFEAPTEFACEDGSDELDIAREATTAEVEGFAPMTGESGGVVTVCPTRARSDSDIDRLRAF